MNAPQESGKYRIVSEINMIPFIDVSLVLLIIFMVMTPFLIQAQIKVNLPTAGKAEVKAADNESIRVQVEKGGRIFIEGRQVRPDDVATVLGRRLLHPKTQPLLIEADKDVAFEHVVTVFDAGRRVGALSIGVCVKPASGPGAPAAAAPAPSAAAHRRAAP
jgi:biopolymer transport protein ExbD